MPRGQVPAPPSDPALCAELHEARSYTKRACLRPQLALPPQPRPLGPCVAPAQTFLQETNPSALATHSHHAALPCGPLPEYITASLRDRSGGRCFPPKTPTGARRLRKSPA